MSIDRSVHLLAALTAAAALGGCHHAVKPAAAAAPAPAPAPVVAPRPSAPAPPPRAAAPAPAPRPLSEDEAFSRQSLDALNAAHPLSDAFFDYDRAELRDDAKDALGRDARWLNRWKSTRVMIQGQCDERGTAEYNLALGDERAKAVRSYLSSLGVAEERIAVVSLGKESPVCHEDGENCWSQNRRGHFVITAK